MFFSQTPEDGASGGFVGSAALPPGAGSDDRDAVVGRSLEAFGTGLLAGPEALTRESSLLEPPGRSTSRGASRRSAPHAYKKCTGSNSWIGMIRTRGNATLNARAELSRS